MLALCCIFVRNCVTMIHLLIYILLANSLHQSPQSFDSQMQKYNLVDINTLDDKIVVNLRYSTSDNFVGVDMYGSLDRAYFVRDFADRVVKAQRILQAKHPE